jgi:hypothetical protein
VETPEWKVPNPRKPVLFAATNSVLAFATGKDGAVWAATEGGVVRFRNVPDAPHIDHTYSPSTWTTADGLGSNDVRKITVEPDGTVVAVSPACESEITPDDRVRLRLSDKPTRTGTGVFVVRTKNGVLTATVAAGLHHTGARGVRRYVPFPAASRASHVSAIVAVPGEKGGFLAGLYNDGVYRVRFADNGAPRWERLSLPEPCRFVTALARMPNGGLLIGTRYGGIFFAGFGDGAAEALTTPHSLPSGDIYGIAAYRGRLYASTFDRGVLAIGGNGVVAAHPSVKQGRTLVPFGDDLYALGADHSVWKFDGEHWKPAWGKFALRRADVYSLALDRAGRRLLVGGFGGWAEWDGQTWRQHWNTPGLENESVTAIAADASGAVWVGTQRRGLFRCTGDTATAFQEAQGLTDDWITSIAVSPKGRLLVGTYTGGVLEKEGDRFVQRLAVEKWAMRRVVFAGERALVATPVGLYREGESDRWEKVEPRLTGGPEIQALLPADGGVWVGTRNGLAFAPFPLTPSKLPLFHQNERGGV